MSINMSKVDMVLITVHNLWKHASSNRKTSFADKILGVGGEEWNGIFGPFSFLSLPVNIHDC